MIRVMVNGTEVRVPAESTLRTAAAAAGVHTPTLCWHPQFATGSNCRMCVVEVTGSRVLVPACTRRAEDGMVVQTDSDRVRRARRLVLELLLGETTLSAAPELQAYATHYSADPCRFARTPAPHHGRGGGEIVPPPPEQADNPFFVRDYDRCILCRRCTEACGVGVQFTFAIAVVGRGAEATIATGGTGRLPESPCVFCGNCVGVCPTGALMPVSTAHALAAGAWAPAVLAWDPETGFTYPPGGDDR